MSFPWNFFPFFLALEADDWKKKNAGNEHLPYVDYKTNNTEKQETRRKTWTLHDHGNAQWLDFLQVCSTLCALSQSDQNVSQLVLSGLDCVGFLCTVWSKLQREKDHPDYLCSPHVGSFGLGHLFQLQPQPQELQRHNENDTVHTNKGTCKYFLTY